MILGDMSAIVFVDLGVAAGLCSMTFLRMYMIMREAHRCVSRS